jgi:hypothetical protein
MIEVKLTGNIPEIESVIKNDDVYAAISSDDSPSKDDFVIDFNNNSYLAGYECATGCVIGVFVYHFNDDGSLYVHVQVLPKYRQKYSALFGEMVMEWLYNNVKSEHVYTHIPTCFENVVQFAIKNGYKIMETVENYTKRNGNQIAAYYMQAKIGQ